MSEHNRRENSDSALKQFWANGGVFAIIAIGFFLLSFAETLFLIGGITFMVLSLIWTANYRRAQAKPDRQDPDRSL